MHTVGKDIVDKNGNKIILKGMGLGGWLVPEGYMLGTWGSPTSIRDRITELIGEDSTAIFYEQFEKNYVAEKDIAKLSEWGFNSVRLPFHYKNLNDHMLINFTVPSLLTKALYNKIKRNNSIISNSYILRFVSSLFGYLIFILFIIFLHGKNVYLNYSIIIGLSIIIKSYEVLFSYFESKSLSKYIVISQTFSLIIVFILIIFFLYLNFDVKYVYYCFLIDSLITLGGAIR